MNKEQLLKDTYQNLALSLLGLGIITVTFFVFFYGRVDASKLITWFLMSSLITLLRYVLFYSFHHHHALCTNVCWSRLFTLGVILSGAIWGAVPILFFINENYLYQMLIMMILSGISAGSLSTLSQIRINVSAFLTFLLVPLIVVLLEETEVMYHYIALLVTLYFIMLQYMAQKLNQNYVSAVNSMQLYQKKKNELTQSEQKFETIFQNVPIGSFLYDKNLIIQDTNQEFLNFLGAPREFIIGLDMKRLDNKKVIYALQSAIDGQPGAYEGAYKTKYANKDIWVIINTNPLFNTEHEVTNAVAIVMDITKRVKQEKNIEYQANHDTLTNIPNRMNLLRNTNREIIRYRRHGIICGVIFLDIDHFKNINDSLGHSIGDELLIQTAKRLQSAIREDDMVARIGGDEFVILLSDLSQEQEKAMIKAELVAQKIHQVFTDAYHIQRFHLNISLSIGIALITHKEESTEDLLKHADIAMYQAKNSGRNTTRFYESYMKAKAKRYLQIENELRNAIAHDELEIHYQPIVSLESSYIIGAEALLRWNNKTLGKIAPDEFIPIAEESGLILSLGAWVLRQATRQFKIWRETFQDTVPLKKIAINVSVNQFNNPHFLTQLRTILDENQIDPNCLELELTESIIIKNIKRITKKMQTLRAMGVNLSIDDFGTGYSSLLYIKKLPFTTLKIDKSFIQDIQDDADDKELIHTILNIAKNFNLETIAEGVETKEQYHFIKDRKATYLQGYYCEKPLSKDAFETLLRTTQGICKKLDS
ncbi:EAL domain-containing protein [Sulfurospirillum sp. 1612]|uniref:EAL domain-containing protein n=1 Tax=Sulfurospirillum sp. 1612 TaxID=3094835 RepID=UPI002F927751